MEENKYVRIYIQGLGPKIFPAKDFHRQFSHSPKFIRLEELGNEYKKTDKKNVKAVWINIDHISFVEEI